MLNTITHMHRRQLALGTILLIVFAVYAPSVRLMLIHDDAINAIWMNRFSLLSIFTADYAASGASARPMSNVLWILTRDLFGWYHPPLIHMWNVWLHVLNAALAGSLAARLGRRFGLSGLLFPTLVALTFGLFPLTYQTVIWAGAIYHPVMLAFGLAALHASLIAFQRSSRALWAASTVLVIAACLSHEAGFLFGVLIALLTGVLALAQHKRLPAGAIVVAMVAVAYAALNRLIAAQAGANANGIRPLGEIAANVVYFMQAIVTWPVILLRPVIGLSEASSIIIVALFIGCVASMLLMLWRWRLFWLGALGVLWWVLMASVPSLVLDAPYVRFGPRLLYAASVGIALLWSAFIAGAVRRVLNPISKAVVLGSTGVLLAWSVPFIGERIAETERLTTAMHAISNDLRDRTPADAKTLFVNMPWWNAPANPALLIGAEGMPIFQHEGAPAWTWIMANSGVQRQTSYVRHPVSLTQDPNWFYGQPGEDLDDAALRQRMLDSDAVYAFDYDPPGLRARRVALITPTATLPASYLAVLADGESRYFITLAEARQCNSGVVLDVGWQRDGADSQPLGVFVHGLDAHGNQVVTADNDLLNGALPLDQLPAGKAVNERRVITMPAAAPAIAFVNIGAYRRSDVARLPASHPEGVRLGNDEYSVPVIPSTAPCE
jgi:hypothetical protein